MDKLIVTDYWRNKAAQHGACSDGLPKVGTTVSLIPHNNLVWAFEMLLPDNIAAESPVPIWALSRSGYGDSAGYGYGYGDGYGYSNGDGNGDG